MTAARHLAIALLLLVGPATHAQTPPASRPAAVADKARSRGGATPEEAVRLMVEGAKAGDVDAAFGLLVDEQAGPIIRWFKGQGTLARAINDHADALDAAFGKAADTPSRRVDFDLKAELRRDYSAYAVVGGPKAIDAKTAELRVSTTSTGPDGKATAREETIKARKTPEGWKLSFSDLAGADFERGVTVMDTLRAGIERSTAGVKEGSIKDREGALRATEQGRPRTFPGAVPLPRYMTQSG